VLFQVATFTIKSEYERWFEIASGLLVTHGSTSNTDLGGGVIR